MIVWRKAKKSSGTGQCMELAWSGLIRDSKNPGVSLPVDVKTLVGAVRTGRVGA